MKKTFNKTLRIMTSIILVFGLLPTVTGFEEAPEIQEDEIATEIVETVENEEIALETVEDEIATEETVVNDETVAEASEIDEASEAVVENEDLPITVEEDVLPVETDEPQQITSIVTDEMAADEIVKEEILKTAEPFFAEQIVDGVKVTVSANAGVFPEGATLRVKRLNDAEKEDAEEAIEKVRDEDRHVVTSYQFDISILDAKGNEIEPSKLFGSARVTFEMAEEVAGALDVNVYHIKDDCDKADDLKLVVNEADESGTVVAADTTSFSLYVVEITYGDLQYVVPGDSRVELSTVLATLNIEGEVTAYSVSNPNLFSITEEDGVLYVNANKAFSSTEWMKITAGGIEYDIVVTDDQALTDDNPLPPQSAQSSAMKYYFSSNGIDIQGINSNGSIIKTTFANAGYRSAIKVNGYQENTGITQLGKVYSQYGVQYKLNVSLSEDGETVVFTYTLYNTNSSNATIQIGNSCDVQIGDNDSALVKIGDDGHSISMVDNHTNDCGTRGIKYTLYSDASTPFGCWVGGYSSAFSNIFTTQQGGSSYNGDSGLAYHWDLTLAPNQRASRTCYFNISPALKVENVTLTADAKTGKIHMIAPFTDDVNRTQTCYYTLEGQSQRTATTSTGSSINGKFDITMDVPSDWAPKSTHAVSLYVIDNAGYRSKDYTFYVYWPGMDADKTAYSTIYFENTSTAFASIYLPVGTKIALPADTGSIDGMNFIKWTTNSDGTGTSYTAGQEYSVTSSNITLYAQWAYLVDSFTVNAIPDQTYTGEALTPAVTITRNGIGMVQNTDYALTYTNNVNVGTATVTITGKGRYSGSRTATFAINNATLTNVSVLQDTDYPHTYDGNEWQAKVITTATAKGNQTVTFKYYLDNQTPTTDIPKLTNAGNTKVNYIASAPYHNDATGYFYIYIKPLDLVEAISLGDVTVDPIPEQVYTRAGAQPTVVVKYKSTELVLGADYTVAYTNNLAVTQAAKALVTGRGNFSGTAEQTFEIVKKELTLSWSNYTLTYNGYEQGPSVVATNVDAGDTVTLTLDNASRQTNAGTYTATITNVSNTNYKLPAVYTQEFTIAKAKMENVTVEEIGDKIYNGTYFTPTVNAKLVTGQLVYTLTEDDFTAYYTTNIFAGSGKIALVATTGENSNFEGTKQVQFTIRKRAANSTGTNREITYFGDYNIETAAEKLFVKDAESGAASYYIVATGTTGEGTINGNTITFTKAGTFVIEMRTEESLNVQAGKVTAILTVKPAPVTVTADDKDKIYGVADETLTAQVEGLVNNETEEKIAYSLTRVAGENVGQYKITPSGNAQQGNYIVTYKTGTYIINPKQLTVDGTFAVNKVYNKSTTASAIIGTVSGIIPADNGKVSVAVNTANFEDYNVGTNKDVTVTYKTIGDIYGNYIAPANDVVQANISAKQLLINGTTVDNKTYDGNVIATATAGTLTNVENGDEVNVTVKTATFDDKNAKADKDVTVVYEISGANAGNYITPVTETKKATVNKKQLLIAQTAGEATTAEDKVYNRSTTATTQLGTVIGIEAVDDGKVTVAVASANFDNWNVGEDKNVTVKYVISGEESANYITPVDDIVTATIEAKQLKIAGTTANDKIYDGNVQAVANVGTLEGIENGDTVTVAAKTATFADRDAANNKNVTVSYQIGGANAGNYIAPVNDIVTASIAKKQLLIAGTIVDDKIYDGNTVATATAGNLTNVEEGDEVLVTVKTATFDDKDARANKEVTVVYEIAGTHAKNYIVPVTEIIRATVAKKQLLMSQEEGLATTAYDKIYNRRITADTNLGTLIGVEEVDAGKVTVAVASATYDDWNVGEDKNVTVKYEISGEEAANYITPVDDIVTATISPKQLLIVDTTVDDKIYDGTDLAVANIGNLVNVEEGDEVNVAVDTANFEDKNAAEDKEVTVVYIIDGEDANNYIAPETEFFQATIGRKQLQIAKKSLNEEPINEEEINKELINEEPNNEEPNNEEPINEEPNNEEPINEEPEVLVPTTTVEDKIYNRSTEAEATLGEVVGIEEIDAEKVIVEIESANFDNWNVGEDKEVTVKYFIYGEEADNYIAPVDDIILANIYKKQLTIVDTTAEDKIFDAKTEATANIGTLEGVEEGDDVTVEIISADFDDENIGTEKEVTVVYEKFGADSFNYIKPEDDIVTANVEPKEVIVTADDKEIKLGEELPEFTAQVEGLIGEDTVEYTFVEFTAENQGIYSIAPTGEAEQGNYIVKYVQGNLIVAANETNKAVETEGLIEVLDKARNDERFDGKTLDVVVRTDDEVPQAEKNMITSAAGQNKEFVFTNTGLYLIITEEGNTTEMDIGGMNDTLIAVTYEFDYSMKKNIQVWRVHENVLEELTETPNEDGEYVVFDRANGTITIYAMKYSTYAFTYENVLVPKTGENNYTNIIGFVLILVALLGLAAILLNKKEEEEQVVRQEIVIDFLDMIKKM